MVNGQRADPSVAIARLTPKQIGFCHSYVECGNASEAYRQNYNAGNMRPATIAVKACELLKNGKVAVTVNQLQAEVRRRHDVTVDGLTTKLEESRALAMDTKQPAAATAAIMATARLHGLNKGEPMVEINIRKNTLKVTDLELARRLGYLLERGTMALTPD